MKKLKIWQRKTQNVTKHKTTQNVNKFKNSKCDITQQLKMWQNSKTQNVTKLTKTKCEKNQ